FLIVILFFANNLFGQARKYVSNSTTGTTVDTIVFTQQVKSGTDTTTRKTGVASIQILSYGALTDTLKYWTDRYGFATDKGILVGKQKVEIIVKGIKTIDTLYLQGNATITRSITAGFLDEINIEDYSVLSGASTSANQITQITRADTLNAELTVVRYAIDQLEGYVDGLETNTNNTKLNIDTLRTLVDQLEGYLDNVETNQTTQIASADSIAARLLRLENSSGASSLLAYKGGLVGTAVDSVVFTGTTRYVNINFGIGATNLDTLFISSTSTFTTNTFFAVIGGFSFADALAYISKIYFKASGTNKQYQIIAR
ncbi:hypothetical protein KKF45_05325, partial [Patescibacteria group bacterium]|nr:hypothetical protein [Patescibacteria group bacterium]